MPDFEDSVLGDDIMGQIPRPGSPLGSVDPRFVEQAYGAAAKAIRKPKIADAIVTEEPPQSVVISQSSAPQPASQRPSNPLVNKDLVEGAGAKVMSDGKVTPNRAVAQGENFEVSVEMRDATIKDNGKPGLEKFASSGDASAKRRFTRDAGSAPTQAVEPADTTDAVSQEKLADTSIPQDSTPQPSSAPSPNQDGLQQSQSQPSTAPEEDRDSDDLDDDDREQEQDTEDSTSKPAKEKSTLRKPEKAADNKAPSADKPVFEEVPADKKAEDSSEDGQEPEDSGTEGESGSKKGDAQRQQEQNEDDTENKADQKKTEKKDDKLNTKDSIQGRDDLQKHASNKDPNTKFDNASAYPENLAKAGLGGAALGSKYGNNKADTSFTKGANSEPLPQINRLPNGGLSEASASSNLSSAKKLSKGASKYGGKEASKQVASKAGQKVASEAGKKAVAGAAKKAIAKKAGEQVVKEGLVALLGPEIIGTILIIIALVLVFLLIAGVFMILAVMVAAEVQRLSEASTIEVLRTLSDILFVVPNAIITVIIDIIR